MQISSEAMMTPNRKSFFPVAVLTVLFLNACVPTGILPTQQQVDTPAAPTRTPIPMNVIQSADYMAGCLEINPNRHQEQIGFQGVYPGKTSMVETEKLLGTPLEIREGYGSVRVRYEYDDFRVGFDNTGSVLYIFLDLYGDTLQNLIVQYGCPQVMWTAYHVAGEQWTFLGYPDLGFQIEIKGFPVSLDGEADILTYYLPTTMTDYFENRWNSAFPDKWVVPWSDAVR